MRRRENRDSIWNSKRSCMRNGVCGTPPGVGKRDLLCKGRRRCNVIAGAVVGAHGARGESGVEGTLAVHGGGLPAGVLQGVHLPVGAGPDRGRGFN